MISTTKDSVKCFRTPHFKLMQITPEPVKQNNLSCTLLPLLCDLVEAIVWQTKKKINKPAYVSNRFTLAIWILWTTNPIRYSLYMQNVRAEMLNNNQN